MQRSNTLCLRALDAQNESLSLNISNDNKLLGFVLSFTLFSRLPTMRPIWRRMARLREIFFLFITILHSNIKLHIKSNINEVDSQGLHQPSSICITSRKLKTFYLESYGTEGAPAVPPNWHINITYCNITPSLFHRLSSVLLITGDSAAPTHK